MEPMPIYEEYPDMRYHDQQEQEQYAQKELDEQMTYEKRLEEAEQADRSFYEALDNPQE